MYEQLLRDASFGAVRVGADRAAVVGALGSPDDMGGSGAGTELLAWHARHLQVAFVRSRVIHFGVYFRDPGSSVFLNGLLLSDRTTRSDFCRWLVDNSITWQESGSPDEGVRVRLGSGVVAVFDEDLLDSLQVS